MFDPKSEVDTLVPVTTIGGFLGAGKTTLLNSVLSASSKIRYAVMVNDFGSLAIDESLVQAHEGDTISFANGCVCCSLGDNLVDAIDGLLARDPRPEQFLIEVSGVANPKAIADIATLHPGLVRDLIITLVDAETVMERASDSRLGDTLAMQMIPADLLVLNKCDLVGVDEVERIDRFLSATYSGHIAHTIDAKLPPELLSRKAWLQWSGEKTEGVGQDQKPVSLESEGNNTGQWDNHRPEEKFYRYTIYLPPHLECESLKKLLHEYQSLLIRAKGFVRDKKGALMQIQLSGKQIDVCGLPHSNERVFDSLNSVQPGFSGQSCLVAIGVKPLDEFKEAVMAAY